MGNCAAVACLGPRIGPRPRPDPPGPPYPGPPGGGGCTSATEPASTPPTRAPRTPLAAATAGAEAARAAEAAEHPHSAAHLEVYADAGGGKCAILSGLSGSHHSVTHFQLIQRSGRDLRYAGVGRQLEHYR